MYLLRFNHLLNFIYRDISIDSYTTCKVKRSACKGKIIRSPCKGNSIRSSCKEKSIIDMPFRIKADDMIFIVSIDLDTTSKGKSSPCKRNSISIVFKGKSIVDMPFPLVGFYPFVVYVSICAWSTKIVDNRLLLELCRKFFCVRVPDIIIKLNTKKLPVGTRCRSIFIFRYIRLTFL